MCRVRGPPVGRRAGEAEWARLEAEITVGETFFFRYAEQFEALRETILPALIAARASERTLRIWSAGCSTGAEPYSLAILVREILGDALPDWRITILGTDISAEALATARAAEYGRWALRTMPPEEQAALLHAPAAGPRNPARGRLRPAAGIPRARPVRARQPPDGRRAGAAGRDPDGGFDLILCRNVLIYFDTGTVAAVVRGLGRRLRGDGWLLLGHAEPSPAFANFLDAVSLPGTVAYRRLADAQPHRPDPSPATAAWAPGQAPSDREGGASGAVGDGTSAAVPALPRPAGPVDTAAPDTAAPDATAPGVSAPDPIAPDAPPEAGRAGEDEAGGLDRIRALADAGETAAAWRALRVALDRDPTDSVLRFYEGLLARTLGRDAEAERALRAALYLDRGFVMAHYHLGLLLIALGRPSEAARALDNAVALSQALAADGPVPESDGASAAEIAAGAAAARLGLGRDTRGRSS